MKKIISIFVSALFLGGLFFTSCQKGEDGDKKSSLKNYDFSGWVDSFEAGKAFAAKKGKKIILFFSDDKDGISEKLRSDFLEKDDFLKKTSADYVLVNIDFGEARFSEIEKAETVIYDKVLGENATQEERDAFEKEKEAATVLVNGMLDDMKLARIYNVEQTPGFFLVSKEGYVIRNLSVSAETNEETFAKTLSESAEQIAEFDSDMKKIRNAKGLEKVKEIDSFFEKTPVDYRYMITDLCQTVVDTDKSNESGLVGKYLLVVANNKAVDYFLEQNSDAAGAEFVKLAENPFLSGDEKQQAYYTAGYLLAQSGSMDYGRMKNYFQKAYDANPESDYASKILDMVKIASEREAEFAEYSKSMEGSIKEYVPSETSDTSSSEKQ